MRIGYIGLGKMGQNMVERLLQKGYRVVAYDVDEAARLRAHHLGAETAESVAELVGHLTAPRLVWVMVPHAVVDRVLGELAKHLKRGDTIIDGGNSFYERTVQRAKKVARRGVKYLDVGVSGGPSGARNGACLMVGGAKRDYELHEELFCDLSVKGGVQHVGAVGAGHFVKMVHNGIEYGMMQALAEGFAVLKRSPYKFDLEALADLYDHGSVIESRLTRWLHEAYDEFGPDLKSVTGKVAHTGEGDWTIRTAKRLGVPVEVIEQSLDFRRRSATKPTYTGQVLSALRNRFGGHPIN
ncbi:MAG TPA: decarboxylating 6-phosphogluconate dehydrogenase [Candidatus Paceibacterota bacterium]|nr:decarboxylating 6-phosphogluconate dehydrogenase [Candidatus Paceibacterota bacterium]